MAPAHSQIQGMRARPAGSRIWPIMKLLPKRIGRRLSTWGHQEMAYRLRGKPRPRFVFVHIPKTAGVTVTKYFRSCFGVLATGRSASLSDPPWHTAYVPEDIPAANQ